MTTAIAQRLVELAGALAIPRRAGSEGSDWVVDQLATRLEDLGFEVDLEEFSYDLGPVERILRWTLAGGACLMVIAGWLAGRSPLWSLVLATTVLAGGGILLGWSPWLEDLYRRGGPTRTANVVGRRLAAETRRRLVLMAHHDSKSQSLTMPVRLFATSASVVGVVAVLAAAGYELAGRSGAVAWVGTVAGTLTAMALLGLAAMTSGNESPGGVDNAGSMAIVLELASRLHELPSDLELVVLFTGAEEDHMLGAMRFLDRHCDEFDEIPTACLNFDGAGSPGRTVLITRFGAGGRFAPRLEGAAVETAGEIGLPIRRIVMAPAVGIDAIPFAHRGIECLTFSSGSLGRATFAVHSAGDVGENLDGATMARIADYAEAVIRKLAG